MLEGRESGLISAEDAISYADSANDVRLAIKLHDRNGAGLRGSLDYEVEKEGDR